MMRRLLSVLCLVILAASFCSILWAADINSENVLVTKMLRVGRNVATPYFTVDAKTGAVYTASTITAIGGVVGGTSVGTFADGTQALPGLRPTNDPDNGIWRSAANTLNLVLGGTSRWAFTTTTSTLTGILAVSGTTTSTGLLSGNGGFALDGTIFTVADTTGVISWVPTTTSSSAGVFDFTTLTSGNGLVLVADDDILNGGKPFVILGGASADTVQLSVAEGGVVYTLGKLTATGGLDTGTGSAGTGATITSAGAASFDGAITASSTLAVAGIQTNAALTNLDGGLAMGTSVLTVEKTTGVVSWVPTSTTADAATFDFSALTSGNGLKLIGVDSVIDGGYYLNVFGGTNATSVASIGEKGVTIIGSAADQNTTAGGTTQLTVNTAHITAALTGDLIAVFGNARVDVDSAAGSVIGGYFKAGNTTSGYNALNVRGVYTEVVNKDSYDASTTWTNARGYEVSMDLDQGASGHTNTITNAYMFYGVYNAPTSGTYSTITNGYGVYVKNEAVGGTGQALDAAFFVDDASMSGGIKGWDYGLDMSGVAAGFTTADIKLGNGELIDNNTNGTIGFQGALNLCAAGGTPVASVGVLAGAGTSTAAPYVMGAGSATAVKALSFYVGTTSTTSSHIQEGMYMNVNFGTSGASAAPSGDAGRFRAYLIGDAGAGGVALVGCHNSVEVATGGSSTGLVIGGRNNVILPNEALTAGNWAGAQAEIYTNGASSEISGGASASLLRLAMNEGTAPTSASQLSNVAVFDINLFSNEIGADLVVDNTSVTASCTAKIRIRINGQTYWLLADSDTD